MICRQYISENEYAYHMQLGQDIWQWCVCYYNQYHIILYSCKIFASHSIFNLKSSHWPIMGLFGWHENKVNEKNFIRNENIMNRNNMKILKFSLRWMFGCQKNIMKIKYFFPVSLFWRKMKTWFFPNFNSFY